MEDEEWEIGLGVSLPVTMEREVIVIHVSEADDAGWFRVRRGPDSVAAYKAVAELEQPEQTKSPFEWTLLGNTGLEVKVTQLPDAQWGLPVRSGPVRIGVRRAIPDAAAHSARAS